MPPGIGSPAASHRQRSVPARTVRPRRAWRGRALHQLLQIVAIVVVLLIVLRVSLRRKGRSFDLRGRTTTLNIATGGLAGLAAGMLLQGMAAGAAIDPAGPGGDAGYGVLASALRSVMPFTGAAFGALGGYILLGTIWQTLKQGERTLAQAWLGRLQIAISLASLLLVARSLMQRHLPSIN